MTVPKDILAFPSQPILGSDKFPPEFGMTLRDWFAGRAMNALVCGHIASHQDHHISDSDAPYIAKGAYNIADAMLAERAKAGAA